MFQRGQFWTIIKAQSWVIKECSYTIPHIPEEKSLKKKILRSEAFRQNFLLKFLRRMQITRKSFVKILMRSHSSKDLRKISFKDLLKILERK